MGLLRNMDWKKLFQMYYGLNVSDQFFTGLDKQLSKVFEETTKIKIGPKTCISWPQEFKFTDADLEGSQGLPARLWLKYGYQDIRIKWASVSSSSPVLTDLSASWENVHFEFDQLDVQKAQYHNKPNFELLIALPDSFIQSARDRTGLEFSPAFVDSMNQQLTANFKEHTGLLFKKKISLDTSTSLESNLIIAETSQLNLAIMINAHLNPVGVRWSSKSGIIYSINDQVDKDDIKFWFESLDPLKYYEQLGPDKISKKLNVPKGLSYCLKIESIQMDCSIKLSLLHGKEAPEQYAEQIADFIDQFNSAALNDYRKQGVVHNASYSVENHTIDYDLDIGSAGYQFFNDLFLFFNSQNAYSEVIIY